MVRAFEVTLSLQISLGADDISIARHLLTLRTQFVLLWSVFISSWLFPGISLPLSFQLGAGCKGNMCETWKGELN